MEIIEPEAGPSWDERAKREQLAAVLDPNAHDAKNQLLDQAQKLALDRALPACAGMHVLDFGCGTGRISKWLSDRGADVEGVDASPEMVEAARRYVPTVRFAVGDGSPFGSPDEQFDVVVSVGVLQYFVPDHERFAGILSEIARVLRPGGRLVAIEQAHAGDLDRGSTLEGYVRGFEKADLQVTSSTPVRRSDSRLLVLSTRWPRLASTPGAARHLVRDAQRRGLAQLPPTHYADVLFDVRKRRLG